MDKYDLKFLSFFSTLKTISLKEFRSSVNRGQV